jgi:hypothetical protein
MKNNLAYVPIPPNYNYKRNDEIFYLRLNGLTFEDIGRKYKLTKVRAGQIFQKHSRIKISEERRERAWLGFLKKGVQMKKCGRCKYFKIHHEKTVFGDCVKRKLYGIVTPLKACSHFKPKGRV